MLERKAPAPPGVTRATAHRPSLDPTHLTAVPASPGDSRRRPVWAFLAEPQEDRLPQGRRGALREKPRAISCPAGSTPGPRAPFLSPAAPRPASSPRRPVAHTLRARGLTQDPRTWRRRPRVRVLLVPGRRQMSALVPTPAPGLLNTHVCNINIYMCIYIRIRIRIQYQKANK